MVPHGCSGRRRARPPARLGGLTSFGAAPRSPPVPSGPSGALHTCGAWLLTCSLARRLEARPGPAAAHERRSQALRTLRCPPHQWCLVADVRLGASSRSPARPRRRPRAPQPGPVGQAAWLSETAVTFAGAGRASAETGVAFAGEQRAFLVRFSVAVVSSVSTVAIQGRAVVMVVSSSPRHSCPCVKKFALLGLMLGVSATKFAQRAQNGPNSAFCGVLGEFFAEMPVEGRCWANFVTAWAWQLGPTTGSVNPSMRS